MTSTHGFLVHCALSLPLLAGMGAVLGGASEALAVAVSGAILLGNLVVGERALRRYVESAASGVPSGAGMLVTFRQMTTIPLAILLILLYGARPVALGLSSVILGLVLHVAARALLEAGGPVTSLASVEESIC